MPGEHDWLLAAGTSASTSREYYHSRRHTATRIMKQYFQKICTLHNVRNKVPIIHWLPKYSLQDLQCDLIGGLTVALTVIPQGLAYAKIANLEPQYGLYSAFMGCFVYMILGTSKDITLGPTAIMSLMTATFAVSPVKDDATYAIVLTLMCGAVQLLMGICQLGIIVNFISYPVINAFTSAAAITIAVGQLKGILGLEKIPREFIHMVYETCKKLPETNVWDLTMGLTSLVLLHFIKKLRQIKWKDRPEDLPLSLAKKIFRKALWLMGTGANAFIVIGASGIVAILIHYGVKDKVSITGDITPGLPKFRFPSFTLKTNNETIGAGKILGDIGAGLGIVPLLGLVEAIAIGKAFARQNGYKIIPNQELMAIGTANIVSSFVSSYPITGSFSRTAVNSQSGVRTPAGGLFTGGVILVALWLLTPLFYYIPKSALSAVIISAVIQMVDYHIVKKLWRVKKVDLLPLFMTFLTSFGLGIEYGILVGIGVSLLLLLYPIARPNIKFQKHYSSSRDAELSGMDAVQHLDAVVLRCDQGLRFPAVEYVQTKILKEMGRNEERPASIVLDCTHLSGLDYTTVQGIIELVADFKRKNVLFAMSCLQQDLLDELQRAELAGIIYCNTVDDAIQQIKDEEKAIELRSTNVNNGTTPSNTDSGEDNITPDRPVKIHIEHL